MHFRTTVHVLRRISARRFALCVLSSPHPSLDPSLHYLHNGMRFASHFCTTVHMWGSVNASHYGFCPPLPIPSLPAFSAQRYAFSTEFLTNGTHLCPQSIAPGQILEINFCTTVCMFDRISNERYAFCVNVCCHSVLARKFTLRPRVDSLRQSQWKVTWATRSGFEHERYAR